MVMYFNWLLTALRLMLEFAAVPSPALEGLEAEPSKGLEVRAKFGRRESSGSGIRTRKE